MLKRKVRNSLFVFKTSGLFGLLLHWSKFVFHKITRERFRKGYKFWIKNFETRFIQESLRNAKNLKSMNIKFSVVVPVYNVSASLLREAVNSILKQSYSNFEICLHDDGSDNPETLMALQEITTLDERIKISYSKKNEHISSATNQALKLATGDYVLFMDNDDLLKEVALYEIYKYINENNDNEIIYFDEEIISLKGERISPIFKPDFGIDTLRSIMFVTHACYKKQLVDKLGGFRKGYEGSQDYDLILRASEKTQRIGHIPHILYSWRQLRGSTALEYDEKGYARVSGMNALQDHIKRMDLDAEVIDGFTKSTYRINYNIKNNSKVSIIIPTRNHFLDVRKCIDSIESKSTYRNFEIILIDNNSDEKESINYFDSLTKKIKVLKYYDGFNFSSINNFAAKQSNGEYLLFLNNDTEIITPSWIESMLEFSQQERVGAVGSMLLYPDNSIQHSGIVLGIGSVAGHTYKGKNSNYPGILDMNLTIRNVSAVTAASMMIKQDTFVKIGGFDENLTIALNDVELCIRLLDKGYVNIYTPFSKLYHFESKSRGYEDTPEKKLRFDKETAYILNKWGEYFKKDRYYNPNLTLTKEDLDYNFETVVY